METGHRSIVEPETMIYVAESEWNALKSAVRPAKWRKIIAWVAGSFAAFIVAMAIIGACIPTPVSHAATRTPVVGTSPSVAPVTCPTGTVNGITWVHDAYSCTGTVVVNHVSISFVRNMSGDVLAAWQYGGVCGDAGYDPTHPHNVGYFSNIDC